MTLQQKTILDILELSDEHLTADAVFVKARVVLPSIALATVYRNLAQLSESGHIRRIVIPDAPDRFDKSLHPHEHLTCVVCGRLSDVPLSDLRDYLTSQTGIEIIDYELSMKHICQQCKEEDLQ